MSTVPTYPTYGEAHDSNKQKGQRLFLRISVWVLTSPGMAHYRVTAEPNFVMEAGTRRTRCRREGRSCYSPGTQLVGGRPRLEPRVSILHSQKTLTSLKITEHKELGHAISCAPEFVSIKWKLIYSSMWWAGHSSPLMVWVWWADNPNLNFPKRRQFGAF